MEKEMTKPEFKMTEEEVFVGAMNAAITGLMSSLGNSVFDMARSDSQAGDHDLTLTSEMIGEIVGLARIAGEAAADYHYSSFLLPRKYPDGFVK
jgi:hypothetical protein